MAMDTYDAAWLDRMYNNRERVPDHAGYFERWARDSARVRAMQACTLDVPYGAGPNETLDVFPGAARGAPVLVFIHGGYWRSLDKRDHSFVAPAFTRAGACVVIPNYDLCPGSDARPVGIADIALQMVAALAWVARHIGAHGGDPSRITVAGHSAGGHLAAMLLGCDWTRVARDLRRGLVRNALSISGLHDLRPIRQTPFLAPSLRLSEQDALRLSPALWPAPHHGTLAVVAGAEESEAFVQQARLMRVQWGAERVPVCETLPGLNHFSIVDAMTERAHRLHQLAWDLLAG